MFQMYADGYGQKTIAWTLNGNAAQRELLKRYFVGKQPRPPRADKPSGAKDWSPHTIHDMLRNPRYLGLNGYGATKRKYIGGTKRIIPGEEQVFEAPHLRIIEDKLGAQVSRGASYLSPRP